VRGRSKQPLCAARSDQIRSIRRCHLPLGCWRNENKNKSTHSSSRQIGDGRAYVPARGMFCCRFGSAGFGLFSTRFLRLGLAIRAPRTGNR
jgi:hypothetical protein